ncbi:hypothetical protein D3C80_2137550 [compost metagenome]
MDFTVSNSSILFDFFADKNPSKINLLVGKPDNATADTVALGPGQTNTGILFS